ncbi:MAG TPA: nucleotidyltransferase family protein [Dehalococcoidia bacterium]|nr:nucleotidyltransferase family protein [Dehalococcoidia bacterium]
MTVAAIILAAGESTRMGRLKQLLPWGGTTLIAWQVAQMREAGADEIVVVLGHAAEQIRPAVPEGVRVALNQAYKEGRATSLRYGAEAVSDDAEAVLILNIDQPRPSWVSRRVLQRWRETRAPIVSPRFAGRSGHPVLISGTLLPELRNVEEVTLGLRAVMERHAKEAAEVSISNANLDVDLNTQADYEAALSAFESGTWSTES